MGAGGVRASVSGFGRARPGGMLLGTGLSVVALVGCGSAHHPPRTAASRPTSTRAVSPPTTSQAPQWAPQAMTISGQYLSLGPAAVAVDLSQVMTAAEEDRGTPMAVVCEDAGPDGSAGEEYSCSATLPTGQPGGTTLYMVDGSGALYVHVGSEPPATGTPAAAPTTGGSAAPPASGGPAGFTACPAPAGQNKFATGSASPGCGAAAAAAAPLMQLVTSGWAGSPPRALNLTYRGTSYRLSCASAAGGAGETLECDAAGRPWMELLLDSAQQ